LFKRRIAVLTGLLLLAGAAVTARLAQMQVLWHEKDDLETIGRAGGDRWLDSVRGAIYTADGLPLAKDEAVFDLSIHFPQLADDGWRGEVSRLCGVPVKDIAGRADAVIEKVLSMRDAVRRRHGRPELWLPEQQQYSVIVRNIPVEVAAVLRADPNRLPRAETLSNIPEARARVIQAHPERFPVGKIEVRAERTYAHGNLAPHIVGHTGAISLKLWDGLSQNGHTSEGLQVRPDMLARYVKSDPVGLWGIEKRFEELLRGRRGCVTNRLVFQVLSIRTESTLTPPQPGADVYLALRSDFQIAANEALQWAATDPQVALESGSLVIVDVRNGEVLAAATYPSYDLARYNQDYTDLLQDQRKPLFFRPVQAALPTGSVYKLMTAVAALEEEKITPQTTFDCAGSQRFEGRRFGCTSSHGRLALRNAIEKSCNVYFYNVASLVGGEALGEWGVRFGLGRPTGVDLPGEASGYIPRPRSLHGTLNLAIGQGKMLATPLQIANMVAVIANGGKLYKPHLFHHAVARNGTVIRRQEPEFIRLAVSQETLAVIREGMRLAVGERGTARRTGLHRFGAAGKTGTAELTREVNHAWFAGFAPYENPRIAFAVVNERTRGGHGGTHAAPIMDKCLEKIWPILQELP